MTITGKAGQGSDEAGVLGTPLTAKLAVAHFAEPLISTKPTTQQEDRALLRAIAAYERRGNRDDFGDLTRYLSQHPGTGWRVAPLTAPSTWRAFPRLRRHGGVSSRVG